MTEVIVGVARRAMVADFLPDADPEGQPAKRATTALEVVVAGELDVATGPTLGEKLERFVEQGHVHLIVDLSGVTFMDSSGLSALLTGFRAAMSVEGSLSVKRPQAQVRAVFDMTKVSSVIPIVD